MQLGTKKKDSPICNRCLTLIYTNSGVMGSKPCNNLCSKSWSIGIFPAARAPQIFSFYYWPKFDHGGGLMSIAFTYIQTVYLIYSQNLGHGRHFR